MKSIIPLVLLLSLSGCLVGTVVGAAVDVTTEVIKVPFKVGSAIVDGVTGDGDEESDAHND